MQEGERGLFISGMVIPPRYSYLTVFGIIQPNHGKNNRVKQKKERGLRGAGRRPAGVCSKRDGPQNPGKGPSLRERRERRPDEGEKTASLTGTKRQAYNETEKDSE